jgi:hypothetical protein
VAAQRKVVVTGEMMQETGDRWRDEHSLADLATFQQWLGERDLGVDAFSRMIRDEALRRLMERSLLLEARRHLTDELHMSGEYDRLVARARDKSRVLQERGLENPGVADAGVSWEAVLRWYFEQRLGCTIPDNIDAYARDNGFEHELDFRRAILREYCFAALPA